MTSTIKDRPTEVGYVPHYEMANWSPQARIAAGIAGMAAFMVSQRMKGITRQITRFAGIVLGMRAFINKDLTQVIGTFLSPTIRLNREMVIHAPTDEIVRFWSRLENYPRFMSFIQNVKTSRHGNLLWEVSGPGSIPVRWEAHVLSWTPSNTIAWRTVPRSAIFNSGKVSVQSLDFERSKVCVELVYALRAGSLGYAIAHILGFDPRTHIEADLLKMKSLIEGEWKEMRDAQLPLSS